MTKLKNFIYCFGVNSIEGKTDIIGYMTSMRPDYIPGLFTFSVNFSIIDIQDGEHTLELFFADPNGEIIAEIRGAKVEYNHAEVNDAELPREHSGINVAAGMQNVNLRCNGEYNMQVTWDGEDMGHYPIYVQGKN